MANVMAKDDFDPQ